MLKDKEGSVEVDEIQLHTMRRSPACKQTSKGKLKKEDNKSLGKFNKVRRYISQ